jgi:hypothetical protein
LAELHPFLGAFQQLQTQRRSNNQLQLTSINQEFDKSKTQNQEHNGFLNPNGIKSKYMNMCKNIIQMRIGGVETFPTSRRCAPNQPN